MIKKVAKWRGKIQNGVYPICYLCGKPITKQEDLTQDHVLSLANGGKTDDSNILPAHSRCNHRKGSMTVVEWFDMINSQRQKE